MEGGEGEGGGDRATFGRRRKLQIAVATAEKAMDDDSSDRESYGW